MAYKSAHFYAVNGIPDHQALKAQLGSLYGVNSMEIDRSGSGVTVTYDNVTLSDDKLQSCLNEIGYRMD